jgi:GNAT superfamily N-acetyltransferase
MPAPSGPPVATAASDPEIEEARRAERRFVVALGGFALEISGAGLVCHEKIPSPRFNFVEEIDVGPERQTAFFERALDLYFQRAIRPTFRVDDPPAEHLDRGLRELGFRPVEHPLGVWLEAGDPRPPADAGPVVRPASPAETDLVASFWTGERERAELRTALEIARVHPNPHEALVPLLAFLDGEAASAAIVYRFRSVAGIHLLTTRPEARGQGCASALVAHALETRPAGEGVLHVLVSGSPQGERRLRALGFRPVHRLRPYVLPADAELPRRPAAPPGPPRWRPPRTS